MAGFLLDTHAFLWWATDRTKLSATANKAIESTQDPVYVSTAAVWEMSIKQALGRLTVPNDLQECLATDHIASLSIALPHVLAVAELPLHHQDPFDRLQIAQARIERLVLVTRDRNIPRYDVEVLKA